MLRLITFGGLWLMHGEVTLRRHGPRQRVLPLLALLAANGRRGVSRSELMSTLWQDRDPGRARHSLDEVVFQVRREGREAGVEDVFADVSPQLRLDPAAITADVWEFDDALHRGEYARAVAICDGRRFADGVSIPEGDALDRRLVELDATYTARYRRALLGVADTSDGETAIAALRKCIDLDPHDRQTTLRLVDALQARHEIAAAIAAGERYQRVLESLGAQPDSDVARRIEELRGASGPKPATPVSPAHPAARPVPSSREDEAQAERERLERVVRPRWQLGASAIASSSTVTTFPGIEADARRRQVEIHALAPAVAHLTSRDRFLTSLRRATALEHTHVLPLLDCNVRERVLYFVTPPRPGMSLKARLAREGALPIRDAVAIAHGLAAALAHAHELGVVHGDLRPKHVHLRTADEPVVGFFGLADAILGDGGPGGDSSSVLTYGEAAYKAPEQLRQRVRTSMHGDVYAFGTLVYEMLAGEPPFADDVARRFTEPASGLRHRRDSVPESLERIVLTCLARMPVDRYASGTVLVEAMRALAP